MRVSGFRTSSQVVPRRVTLSVLPVCGGCEMMSPRTPPRGGTGLSINPTKARSISANAGVWIVDGSRRIASVPGVARQSD
jgi:hypothetical protein